MSSNRPPKQLQLATGSGVSGPEAGFGPLWRKTFQIELSDITIDPIGLVSLWKREFGTFWPGDNRFQAPVTGLGEGELAEVKLEMPGGLSLSTGVRLLYSEPTSFALLAPPGHIISGWNTFSAIQDDEITIARIEILMRASDPLFAASLALGGHRRENQFWLDVLSNLARRCDSNAIPGVSAAKIDSRILIRNFGNIRHNAILLNGLERSRSLFGNRRGGSSQSVAPNESPP